MTIIAEGVVARGSLLLDGQATPTGSDQVDRSCIVDDMPDAGYGRSVVPKRLREAADKIELEAAADQAVLTGQRTYVASLLSEVLSQEVMACDALHIQAHDATGRRPQLDMIRLSLSTDRGNHEIDLWRLSKGTLVPSNEVETWPSDARLPAGSIQTLADTNLEVRGSRGFWYKSLLAGGLALAEAGLQAAEQASLQPIDLMPLAASDQSQIAA